MPKTRLITAEEFEAMPDDGRCLELVRGEIVEVSRPGLRHGELSYRLARLLDDAGAGPPEYRIVVGDPGFLIERDPDTVRGPDVAIVRRSRTKGHDDNRWMPFAPDLVVEVVSPSDSFREVEAKARMWLDTGSLLVWVVEPTLRRVFVYTADGPRLDLGEEDRLTGGDLLPSLSLPVREIFATA